MASLIRKLRNRFQAVSTLPVGMHHFQSPPDAPAQYRLHLRLESDGTGVLILNASTVLHLNQTAAECAYLWVKDASPEHAAKAISSRYRVSHKQAMHDYMDFIQRVETLLQSTDLDPVTYLDFGRHDPYSKDISAPYRLDCALTYRLPEGESLHYAPTERAKNELTSEEWNTILDKAWAAGIPHVVFTGGEPALRDDLTALIAHSEKNGQVCGLLSGSLRLASAEYLKTLLDSGLDHLMYLLQPDKEESWTAVQKAMESDLSTTVHLTLNRELAARAGSILERLHQADVKALSLSASDPAGAEALVALRDRAAELGLTLQWDLPVPYSPANPVAQEIGVPSTGAGKAWLYVEPDGDVLPEQGVNRVLGNFLRDPWAAIWEKARA
ncbi:MAG: radical SAM protein [Anaerolineales bacterium]